MMHPEDDRESNPRRWEATVAGNPRRYRDTGFLATPAFPKKRIVAAAKVDK
jgi:hypothetical protein